jgi:Domain of unknown function (DUF1648)
VNTRRPPEDDIWDDEFEISEWEGAHPRPDPNRPTGSPASWGDEPRDVLRRDHRTPETLGPPPRLSRRVPPSGASGGRGTYEQDPSVRYPTSPNYDYPTSREPYRSSTSGNEVYSEEDEIEATWQRSSRYPQGYPAPSQRSRRQRSERRARRQPIVIPRPALADTTVTAVVASALVGLLIMIATLAIGADDLPDVIPVHLNASGDPDHWGSTSTLWRIPFGVFMVIVIGIAIGAITWKRDRFAARFVIFGSCLIQIIAWVAVVDYIW